MEFLIFRIINITEKHFVTFFDISMKTFGQPKPIKKLDQNWDIAFANVFLQFQKNINWDFLKRLC